MGDHLNFQKIVARYFLQVASRKRALSAKCERLYYYYFNSVKRQTALGHVLRDKANIFISLYLPPHTHYFKRKSFILSERHREKTPYMCVAENEGISACWSKNWSSEAWNQVATFFIKHVSVGLLLGIWANLFSEIRLHSLTFLTKQLFENRRLNKFRD